VASQHSRPRLEFSSPCKSQISQKKDHITASSHAYNLCLSVTSASIHVYNLCLSVTAASIHVYNLGLSVTATSSHVYKLCLSATAASIHVYNLGLSATSASSYLCNLCLPATVRVVVVCQVVQALVTFSLLSSVCPEECESLKYATGIFYRVQRA
jgi:hypothetical protein